MASAQHFTFQGHLDSDSFAAFARHRAARLDLELVLQTGDSSAVQLSVTGKPELVDMFEMAMSLGPHDCIVLDVVRH